MNPDTTEPRGKLLLQLMVTADKVILPEQQWLLSADQIANRRSTMWANALEGQAAGVISTSCKWTARIYSSCKD